MNILPVWIADWQIGCCGDEHVATMGEPWAEAMLLRPSTLERATPATLGWRRNGQEIEFTGMIAAPSSGGFELDLGSIRLGLRGAAPDHKVWASLAGELVGGTGSVHADWHGPSSDDEIMVRGIVRRISTAKQILEQTGERSFRVVGHEPPVEIDRWPPSFSPDLVLELEIPTG